MTFKRFGKSLYNVDRVNIIHLSVDRKRVLDTFPEATDDEVASAVGIIFGGGVQCVLIGDAAEDCRKKLLVGSKERTDLKVFMDE